MPGSSTTAVDDMDSNEETRKKIQQDIQAIEAKVSRIEDNVGLLTNIFEEILKEFEKIKKDIADQNKKNKN